MQSGDWTQSASTGQSCPMHNSIHCVSPAQCTAASTVSALHHNLLRRTNAPTNHEGRHRGPRGMFNPVQKRAIVRVKYWQIAFGQRYASRPIRNSWKDFISSGRVRLHQQSVSGHVFTVLMYGAIFPVKGLLVTSVYQRRQFYLQFLATLNGLQHS